MSLELSVINYESELYPEVLYLRYNVLRLPLGLELTEDDVIEDKNQYIIIGQRDSKVVACLMLKILDKDTVKFRQMAVDPIMQQSGIGTLLINYAENFCFLNEYSKLELNARKSAKGFYLQLGYQPVGEHFTEVGIPHIKMMKILAQ